MKKPCSLVLFLLFPLTSFAQGPAKEPELNRLVSGDSVNIPGEFILSPESYLHAPGADPNTMMYFAQDGKFLTKAAVGVDLDRPFCVVEVKKQPNPQPPEGGRSYKIAEVQPIPAAAGLVGVSLRITEEKPSIIRSISCMSINVPPKISSLQSIGKDISVTTTDRNAAYAASLGAAQSTVYVKSVKVPIVTGDGAASSSGINMDAYGAR
jgi:hypothetical protein